MKLAWFAKHGRGFLPGNEAADKIHRRLEVGEMVGLKEVKVRDAISFRRYWKLMDMCADNCEQIRLPYGGIMLVKSRYDVHIAVKLCTGYCDTIFDAFGKPAFQIPKSTDFDEMTQQEWEEYWPRINDAIAEVILPGVSLRSVETEIMKCMGWAA